MSFNIYGATFEATQELAGSALCMMRGRPEANDTGPNGQVMEMEAFVSQTKDLKALVDIGACLGVFSLVFTSRSGTMAYAIEGSPWAYPMLKQALALNPDRKIIPINAFLGETHGRQVVCGKRWCHLVPDGGNGADWQRQWCGHAFGGESATMTEVRLDDLQIDACDCMKIDVEAWEIPVLIGAKATISKFRPTIFLEAHVATLPGHGQSWQQLYNLLIEYGYRSYDFDGNEVTSFADNSIYRVICRPN